MPENQNFYIIQHGVRWSGMPAWDKTLSDTQMWQLVTFLSNIEKLPPAAKREFDLPGTPAAAAGTRSHAELYNANETLGHSWERTSLGEIL